MSIDNNIDFKDHIVQYPNRFKQTTVAPGIVELVPTWIETPEQIIQPGTPVDSELFKKLKQNVTIYQQTFMTTDNQTVINLNRDFLVGQNRVSLSIGGVRQYAGQDYTETDSHTLTMATPQKGGLKAEVIMFTASQAIAEDFFEKTVAAIAATQAANDAATQALAAKEMAYTVQLTPVANFAAVATTYPTAVNGSEVQTLDDGKIYRKENGSWVYRKSLTPGPVVALSNSIDSVKTYLSVTDQPDFVKDLQRLSSTKQKMNVQIAVGNLKQFFVNIQNTDTKGVTYAFRRNGNDDYITLMEGAIGTITPQYAVVESKNNDTESGTFVKTNAPNYYTTTTNNWLATTFTGTMITLNSYANNQGGLWEAVLNEGTAGEQRVNVSVYSATAIPIKETTLFQNLEKKKHTLKLIFKGQDPSNPVSTPRGWYFYGGTRAQDVARTFNVYDDTFSIAQTTQALYSYSNKEFAISARPAGTTGAYQFFPEHNAVGTAFNLQDTQLLVDGKAVTWNTGNYYNDVETVQLIQKVKGVYPGDANPLLEVITYHTIKNGAVTVSGRIKFLRNTQIDVGYAGMLPYFTSFAKKIRSSLGNTYNVITDQPNLKEYWNESDKNLSVAVVNDADSGEKMNTVVAMTLENFKRTNRFDETGRGTPFSWIEHRGSTLGKIYFQQFQNVVINSGYEYRFDVRYLTTLLPMSSEFIL